MKEKLPFSRVFVIGLMLFSMFLGAGNIIFAPQLGQLAGTNTWGAMVGFLITGVGLVLLAIIALAISGGTVEKLADLVHPKFSLVFSVLLFLTLGPIYVIPRTTSVVYEISIAPTFGNLGGSIILFVFSVIFISLTVWLSLTPGKFIDRLGKVITPVFGILLLLFIAKSFITPMGEIGSPQAPYLSNVFLKGFVEGYYTMDVLAAFVFGGIFIKSIANEGLKDRRAESRTFLQAGIITVIGLAILQISMAWIGATSVDAVGMGTNGGEILAWVSQALFGKIGLLIIGTIVMLTGITTNIACLSSVAEYFERVFPRYSYKGWVYIMAFGSLIITNFGLSKILDLASPVLLLLYPLAIALIALSFTHKLFNGYQAVYVGTMIGVGLIAILDATKDAGLLIDPINRSFSFLPLFENGAGWIVTGLIGALIGYIYAKSKSQAKRTLPIQAD